MVQAGRNLYVGSHAVGLLRKQIGKCSFCNEGCRIFVHSEYPLIVSAEQCEFNDEEICN